MFVKYNVFSHCSYLFRKILIVSPCVLLVLLSCVRVLPCFLLLENWKNEEQKMSVLRFRTLLLCSLVRFGLGESRKKDHPTQLVLAKPILAMRAFVNMVVFDFSRSKLFLFLFVFHRLVSFLGVSRFPCIVTGVAFIYVYVNIVFCLNIHIHT